MIKGLYGKIRKAMIRMNWKRHSASLAVSGAIVQVPLPGMALILAPHADDELIGCHMYMQRSQCTAFCCALTGSDPSEENRTIRNREFLAYCSANSIPSFISQTDLENALTECINNVKPDAILLPSVVDWHPEHRMLNEVLVRVTKQMEVSPRIIWYQVSIPIPGDRVNLVLPMDKAQYRQKWEAFRKCYPSQAKINLERFQFVEKKRIKGHFGAECFRVLSYDCWTEAVSKMKMAEDTIADMKHSINDFAVTERSAKEMYDYVLGEEK